jgi:glyoxylase-like metal-dependent hydrolase (beta-lactamase superfamily II)
MKSVKKEVTLIADKTWLISDYYLDNYYLAVGDKKAALIDTGCGIGNVLDEVREITDLPVEVLLTHGHLDHCGGMFSLESCYMCFWYNKNRAFLCQYFLGKIIFP